MGVLVHTIPDVSVVALLSELLYCRPNAFTQALYTVPQATPWITHCVAALVALIQEATPPFMSSK